MKKILMYLSFPLMMTIPVIVGLCVQSCQHKPDIYESYPTPGVFYDNEPAGTRTIKESDDILRANLMSLKEHFEVDHVITGDAYSGSAIIGQGGTFGHHKEGSARITWDTAAPASNEEGKLWCDEDTYIVQVADSNGVWRNMTVAESVTARGSMSDLDSRLDVLLNEDGTFKPQNINLAGYRVLMAAASPTSGRELCTKSYADSIVGAGGTHAASHTDGTDDIQDATNSVKGLMTAADHSLLMQHTTDIANLSNKFRREIVTIYGEIGNSPESTNVEYSAALAFDHLTDEKGYFSLVLDDDEWNSTSLEFKTRYSMAPGSTAVPGSTVTFVMGWRAVANGEGLMGGQSGTMQLYLSPGNSTTLMESTGNWIPAASLANEDMITVTVYRDADAVTGDDQQDDLYIHSIRIEEQ